MNGELILDAMNYLDDHLVEATGKLRNRKRRPYWLVPVAAAACLCLLISNGTGKSLAPMEAEKTENYFGDGSNGVHDEAKPEQPMDQAASGTVVYAVLCVTEVGENCFAGTEKGVADAVGDAECIKIFCSPEIVSALQVGDLVRVHYKPGQENLLIDIEPVLSPGA